MQINNYNYEKYVKNKFKMDQFYFNLKPMYPCTLALNY